MASRLPEGFQPCPVCPLNQTTSGKGETDQIRPESAANLIWCAADVTDDYVGEEMIVSEEVERESETDLTGEELEEYHKAARCGIRIGRRYCSGYYYNPDSHQVMSLDTAAMKL